MEHAFDHALEHVANFLFGEERRLNIDLGEFGLTIGTQIFVAEAFGDLVITVVSRHHQQLFEQLRRLGQGKKLAIVHTAGHQVITRTFGCALGEHGRFDVDKTVFVEVLAHFHCHFVAQHEIALHVRTAQIEHAMGQTRGLRQVVVVNLERRRDRGIEHHQLVAQHFDLAAFQSLIGRALGTRTHHAFDLNAKLVAQVFGNFEHLGTVWIAHHLDIALAVAQVHKDHATVVTATVDPTAQSHGLTVQSFGHQTAIVGTHCHF